MTADRSLVLAAIARARANGFSEQQLLAFVYEQLLFDRDVAIRGLLYSHDFARALFGDQYRRHLQQMILADDPLAYVAAQLTVSENAGRSDVSR